MARRNRQHKLEVLPQPDHSACGPTCLHAVYRYWGREVGLDQVISEIAPLPGGGTLAVSLACHALRRGFGAEIYTYNLQLFDPTWFSMGIDIADRLRGQKRSKRDRKFSLVTDAYVEFMGLGGSVRFEELTAALLRRFLNRGVPVLTGLSATYLYNCSREHKNLYDDIRGQPVGHFVVLCGYDRRKQEVMVADPMQDNPRFGSQYYRVGMDRLIASILLGIVTHDANLLIVTPKGME